ncbi:intraflagellar transport protein 20 homolog [Hydractinia symbiolongicarpus]|uniref:intraflagellar transport protein 20 homolog n=1 Tax=Hydractinia symbiolongicarpus TaxID=13093 RepID=UPI002549EA67|nr:intraflagellar transport protein 20 homolog [Hydractinia symbiolongicarpus]
MSSQENGIFFDEMSKVRVLEPEVSQQTQELKTECKDFVEKISDFQKIVGSFIDMVDTLAKEVEKEKMKAIGSRNLLKSMAKQRESQQQQLRALIAEKQTQLERYRLQYDVLLKQEAEQNDFVEQFMMQK